MLTALFIIWVICKIVEYHEDREDEREYQRYLRDEIEGRDRKSGDTWEINARSINFYAYTKEEHERTDWERLRKIGGYKKD